MQYNFESLILKVFFTNLTEKYRMIIKNNSMTRQYRCITKPCFINKFLK